MKAPDKIYIQTNSGEAFSSKWTTIPFRDFENTEYIHKDALLKMVKERLKLYDPDNPEEETVCYELQSIIRWLDGKEVAE